MSKAQIEYEYLKRIREYVDVHGLDKIQRKPTLSDYSNKTTNIEIQSQLQKVADMNGYQLPQELSDFFNQSEKLFEKYATNDFIDPEIRMLAEEVENDIVMSFGKMIHMPVFVGEYPTHSFNAQAEFVPGGALILINTGLRNMIDEIVKIIGLTITFTGTPGPPGPESIIYEEAVTIERETIAGLVINVICSYLFLERIPDVNLSGLFDFKKLGFHRIKFWAEYTAAIKKFVVAHEFGHILAGHLDETRSININSYSDDLNLIAKDWLMEYEADIYAIRLQLGSGEIVVDSDAELRKLEIIFLGAMIFFEIDRLINMIWKEMKGYGDVLFVGDHPPSNIRWKRINDYYTELVGHDIDTPYINTFQYWFKTISDYTQSTIRDTLESRFSK